MSKDIVLLTGAGFTKNFDGFLSSDMWEQFFNNPKMPDELKILMKKGSKGDDDYFNYEDVVQTVSTVDKYIGFGNDIKTVVEETYIRQEQRIDADVIEHRLMVDKFRDFIFANISLFFTLNQDTFVEKYLHKKENQVLTLPFLEADVSKKDKEVIFKLPTEKDLQHALNIIPILKGDRFVNYIKLHGSRNWYDSQGKNFPVIGKNKREMIEKEPLLKKYYEYFSDSLNNSKKLLIIGYSFLDKHINEIIRDGVIKGLKLFIVDAISSKQLWVNLMAIPHNSSPVVYNISDSHKRILREIWPGVSGYLKINNIDDLLGNDHSDINDIFPVLFV